MLKPRAPVNVRVSLPGRRVGRRIAPNLDGSPSWLIRWPQQLAARIRIHQRRGASCSGKLFEHEGRMSFREKCRRQVACRMSLGIGLLCVALAGCTPLRPASPSASTSSAPAEEAQGAGTGAGSAPPVAAPAGTPAASASRAQSPAVTEPNRAATRQSAIPSAGATAATTDTPSQTSAAAPGAARPARTPAKKPVTPPASPAPPTAPPAKQPVVSGAENAPAPPALDLTALEQRLRDTHAIGVFTKLSLKNQVDDLLNQFRAFHSGQSKAPLTQLRQQYDLLLLKVLSLLQDSDHELAAAISSSREAIWGILRDPQKFAKI
jgi:hypothetical protein